MSQAYTKLDPLTVPLVATNLIEASAGTGKTHTITILFLRLLLEKKLTINQILVVTFTEAATKELRDRIRKRIRNTLTLFQKKQAGEPIDSEETIDSLLNTCQPHLTEAIERLRHALRGFDEAAIFTIHSFCRQTLRDNAFESGMLFDTELLTDQRLLIQEIVEDFWRQHFYTANHLFISYLQKEKYKEPRDLLNTIGHGRYIGQTHLHITPELSPDIDLHKIEATYLKAFNAAKKSWEKYQVDIQTLLVKSEGLNGTQYKTISIPNWCEQLSVFFSYSKPALEFPEKFTKFTNTELKKGTKKNGVTPQHEFFDKADNLQTAYEAIRQQYKNYLLTLKTKLFTVVEDKLGKKKRLKNVQSFDDLLTNLANALDSETGNTLANRIRHQFPAALIDEFQDTDPTQYSIFSSIYNKLDNILFLIGDPKQAIYGFRGADIFAYIKAAQQVKNRYTLQVNWRSTASLVTAINALFTQTPNPFIFDQIGFTAVDASPKLADKPLLIDNEPAVPLHIWLARPEPQPEEAVKTASKSPKSKQENDDNEAKKAKSIPKEWANTHIPKAVGAEIVQLLSKAQRGEATIASRPIQAGDIAILVRTNHQAQQMQKQLSQLGLQSVLYSQESIFKAQEAIEIERILLAITEPNREDLIKAALTTDLFGLSGDSLYILLNTERDWQKRLKSFFSYHLQWQTQGFIQMFRQLLIAENIPQRLLAYPDGERRLTNVLHLAEVLQKAVMQEKLGLTGLCNWLTKQREQAEEGEINNEQQLRLESDERLIKIVTIHKSKGLEYPIVFCPYAWEGILRNEKAAQFLFHDPATLTQRILDLGSTEQEKNREYASREELAENLRLFYVAVTRAAYRCYLVWGAINDADTAPLAHLLYRDLTQVDKEKDKNWLFALTHEALLSPLAQLAEKAPAYIQVSEMKLDIVKPYQRAIDVELVLQARQFHGQCDDGWRVSSYSGLLKTKGDTERPDYDDAINDKTLEIKTPSRELAGVFTFPKGAKAGRFLHHLLENTDFTEINLEEIQRLLILYGFSAEKYTVLVQQWLLAILHTPLEVNQPDFILANISREQRLNELEFYYPVHHLTVEGLRQLFTEHGQTFPAVFLESVENLTFTPQQGFMKGSIDMIFQTAGRFYLVDYKSNLLGVKTDAYHHSKLPAAMEGEAYYLQYILYLVALHRYLQNRLPDYHYETHIGGVYYLFLRGMNPNTGANYGVFRDKPSVAFIEQLSQYCWQGNG
ncbi:exodeoxyribonuclease V subunit beta [Beggiatoa leptomitoformis]|uniref:RecBCD enzyme subunit RecB n=1 Tax=Beggiatoa leptomitoformis TaxID=288004 RepID=A0A2N9YEU9_9GAMM|nr:exodeoxyribonuclease V subunit beta [Beggiatoa leptomitoformis]ALG68638.1 exodeoxyribonuclease V subunit beta [Beggiatoa leptomitoformis]AUI69013.1 exodeoxyribonuclease V subunit beta [Beggiatoa leptomitoformis]